MARWAACSRCQGTVSAQGLQRGLCAACRAVVDELEGQLGMFEVHSDPHSNAMAQKAAGAPMRGVKLRILAHLAAGQQLSDQELQRLLDVSGDTERPARVGLERSGLVRRAGTGLTASGNSCHLYRITDAGLAALADTRA